MISKEAAWRLALDGVPATNIPVLTGASTDRQLATGRGILRGFLLIEYLVAAVRFALYDGTDATGELLFEFNQAAGGSANVAVLGKGWTVKRGVFYHVISGVGGNRGALYFTLQPPT